MFGSSETHCQVQVPRMSGISCTCRTQRFLLVLYQVPATGSRGSRFLWQRSDSSQLPVFLPCRRTLPSEPGECQLPAAELARLGRAAAAKSKKIRRNRDPQSIVRLQVRIPLFSLPSLLNNTKRKFWDQYHRHGLRCFYVNSFRRKFLLSST